MPRYQVAGKLLKNAEKDMDWKYQLCIHSPVQKINKDQMDKKIMKL